MARTRRDIPPATQTTAHTTSKGKHSREVDTIDVAEVEQPAPGKKAKTAVSKSKRQHEIENPPIVEPEEVVVTKKARTGKNTKVSVPQAPPRRSDRPHPTPIAVPQKRKRRTKAEIAADKAKTEAEKKQLEEITEENHRTMARMDIEEDINRAETAARTIRTFADLENNTGEEFIGYEDVEDSGSESGSEAEDALALKVRFPS